MERQTIFEGFVHAPEFPGDLDWLNTSRPLQMRDLQGKFLLFDFWTYCCINCLHILPQLKKLEQEFQRELIIIGVHSAKFHTERHTEQIRLAIRRYEIEHPVVNDNAFQMWETYAIRAWPTVLLINPEGNIIGSMTGEQIYEPVRKMLRDATPYFESKGTLDPEPRTFIEPEADTASLLSFPGKIAAHQATARLFISDTNHHRLLIADASGRILDTIGAGQSGTDDGSFQQAQFRFPQGIAVGQNELFVADTGNHLIRRIDLEKRTVSTVLGTGEQAREPNVSGTGRQVPLNSPWDLALHGASLYIAMAGWHQIWIADTGALDAEPFAGTSGEALEDGWRKTALLAQPSGLALSGDTLYFADSESSAIRALDLRDGQVTTLIGKGLFDFGDIDGYPAQARLQHPLGVAIQNGKLYVADTYNSKIKVIETDRPTSRTIAGTGRAGNRDGRGRIAEFNEPAGLAFLNGSLYIADTNNHAIRILNFDTSEVSTLHLTDPASR